MRGTGTVRLSALCVALRMPAALPLHSMHEDMAQMGCRMLLHLMHHTSGGDAPQRHGEMMANCVSGAAGSR